MPFATGDVLDPLSDTRWNSESECTESCRIHRPGQPLALWPYGPMALGPSSPASLSCRDLQRLGQVFSFVFLPCLKGFIFKPSANKLVRPDDDACGVPNHQQQLSKKLLYVPCSFQPPLLAVILPSDFPRVKNETMNMLTACVQQPRLSMTRKRHFARDWCKFSSSTNDM